MTGRKAIDGESHADNVRVAKILEKLRQAKAAGISDRSTKVRQLRNQLNVVLSRLKGRQHA